MSGKIMRWFTKKNILFGALILSIVTIPLENNWNSWALVLFCIAAIIQQPIAESIKRLKNDGYWKISALFFLWLVTTWFWDTSGGFSEKYVEANAIFLFGPIAMAVIPRISPARMMLAMHAFIAAIVIVCIICLIKSTIEYQETQDYRVFFYHYLGNQMGLNAIYLSNYCIACIIWLLYYAFIYTGPKVFKLNIYVSIGICVFLFLMMFFLSSKFSLALITLFLLLMVLYIGRKRKSLIKAVLILGLTGIVSVVLVKNLHYLNWRIAETKLKRYSGSQDDQNGLALRITTWTTAIELIKERPLLGYGLKGTNDALLEKYIEKKFNMGIPERYNSHNQFLEITLKSGLIGLLIFLTMMGVLFFSALRRADFLLMFTLIHFILVSQVEGTLEVQQELTFYTFFLLLFYYHPINRSLKKDETGSSSKRLFGHSHL